MTRRLILVRHGRSVLNAAGRMVSVSDPDLDAVGVAQAEALGRVLRGCRAPAYFSSPRRRAAQTAAILAAAGGVPSSAIAQDERLVELGFGDFENLTQQELQEPGHREVYLAWRQGEPPLYPLGAETFEAAGERAAAFFRELGNDDRDTIVVGHGHQLRILVATCILAVDPGKHRRLRLDHGHMTVVEWERETPRLAYSNVQSFP